MMQRSTCEHKSTRRTTATYVLGWQKLSVIGLLSLYGILPLYAEGIERHTILREMKINGIIESPTSQPTMAQRDTIELKYACKTNEEKKTPFLFSVTLSASKSGLKRTETLNSSAVKYTGLPEDNYTFTVFSYVPGQWKTEPFTFNFTVNTAEAPKRIKQPPAKVLPETDSTETEKSTEDSVLTQNEQSGSFPWIPIGTTAAVLGFAGIAYNVIRKRKVTKINNSTVQPLQPSTLGDDMSNNSKIDELTAENAQLKAEIAALRGQMDALQLRGDELYNRNKELEDSVEKIAKKKSELEELQNQKDELFAMVIHDIKNPAGLIKGLVELLRSYDLTALEQSEVMDDLVETSRKIVALSQEVCKVMALESGHMNLNYEESSVENIIQTVSRRNETAAKLKSMGIMLELPSDLPAFFVDINKIEEVLDNLVNNAIKFSHNGAKVRIRAYRQDREMVVEVSDNGLGLSEEDIKSAFQRGAKLSARPTGGELSSGLGLWLVKRIVEAHKGRVWVRSAVGRGSTFAFQIPLYPPKNQAD